MGVTCTLRGGLPTYKHTPVEVLRQVQLLDNRLCEGVRDQGVSHGVRMDAVERGVGNALLLLFLLLPVSQSTACEERVGALQARPTQAFEKVDEVGPGVVRDVGHSRVQASRNEFVVRVKPADVHGRRCTNKHRRM